MKGRHDFFFGLIAATLIFFAIQTSVALPGNTDIPAGSSVQRDTSAAQKRKTQSILKIQKEHQLRIMNNGQPLTRKKTAFISRQSFNKKLPHVIAKNTDIDGSTQTVFPDFTFGINGAVSNFINGGDATDDQAFAVAIQASGKIIAAGKSYDSSVPDYEIALTRYNSDGSVDNTFGSDGTARSFIFGSANIDDEAKAIAIQADGKIVVAGSSITSISYTTGFAVARYDSNGHPDNTFGNSGNEAFAIPQGDGFDDEASAVAIQPDGKIVVAGFSENGVTASNAFALVRLNADGSFDSTFGTNGSAINYITGGDNSDDYITSIALQPDGKIVAAGSSRNGVASTTAFAVARYNSDGSLDNTFGTNGTIRNFIAGGDTSVDIAYSVALTADGKIVAAGSSQSDSPTAYAFALARYTSAGVLDNTFGTGGSMRGFITGGNNLDDICRSIVIRPDGKIAAAGFSQDSTLALAFALGFFDSTGETESIRNFISTSSNNDMANSLALTPDGKLVSAGVSQSSGRAFAVSRYVTQAVGISTLSATGIGNNSATLNGTINAGGLNVDVRFLYGTTSGTYTDSTAVSPSTIGGDSSVSISALIRNLSLNTKYYYNISAAGSSGYYRGVEKSFTTSRSPLGPGYALQFNSSDFTYANVSNAVYNSAAFTIEFWFKSTSSYGSSGSQWYNGVGLADAFTATNENDFGIALAAGHVLFGIGNPDHTIQTPSTYNDGKWHHVAASWTNSTGQMLLYVDGALVSSRSSSSTNFRSDPNTITIGTNQNQVAFLDGTMDELRIWSSVLSQQTIQAWMNRSVNATHPNFPRLLAYYTLDEGTGHDLNDLSGNGEGGLTIGSPAWVTSTAPLGSTGSWVTSKTLSQVGSSGTSLSLTLTSTPDSASNNAALYTFGSLSDSAALGESFPAGIQGREPIIWGVYARGNDTANIVINYGGFLGVTNRFDLRLLKRESADSAWADVTGQFVNNTSDSTFSANNLSSFCEFAVGGASDNALNVEAGSFAAQSDINSVTLTWKTASEVNNAGFNIMRKAPSEKIFSLIGTFSADQALKGLGNSASGKAYVYKDVRLEGPGTYSYQIQSVNTNGAAVTLTTMAVFLEAPKTYTLYQNYPNPFNPSTTIQFDLKQFSAVTIDIYNVLGQRVIENSYGNMAAGRYNEVVNMDKFASGIYYYRIVANGTNGEKFTSIKNMILLK